MAISIKDPETDRLIRALTNKTGESQVAAVKAAVAERLERLEREETGQQSTRRERLGAIARDTAPRLARTKPSTEIGDLLYDEAGLPT